MGQRGRVASSFLARALLDRVDWRRLFDGRRHEVVHDVGVVAFDE